MKRFLQLFLAGIFLLSFCAQARMILPKGGENWSIGSSVQLEWEVSSDSVKVDIQLIRQRKDPIVIAEDVADTGNFLWKIPANAGNEDGPLAPARDYRIEIIKGATSHKSRPFRIMGWDAQRLSGPFDEQDRSTVTHPLEAAVHDQDDPTITLTWDDYRSFLDRLVSIELRKPGQLKFVSRQNKVPNAGSFDWLLTTPQKTDCQGKEGCYFIIRSGRKHHQLITSHLFTLNNPAAGDVFTFDEIEGPKAPGEELLIAWTAPAGKAEPVRIDLLRADAFYQSITERTESVGERNEHRWIIPATVTTGEDYAVRVTSLKAGTRYGLSSMVAIQSPESKIRVNDLDNVILRPGRTSQKLRWKKTTEPVNVDLYRDGRRVKTIARNLAQGIHLWKLPASLAESDRYTIRVVNADDASVYGQSNRFAITLPAADAVAAVLNSKRCLDLGLAENCTTEQAKVKRLERLRECVRYQLYGQDCTKAKLEEAAEERAELLARANDSPTSCATGAIVIGDQCRPESQCPGLHLLDDPRSVTDRTELKGPRRCDQYLLHSDGTEATAELASVLHYLLTLMHRSNSFQVNWEIAEKLYQNYHQGGGSCLSKQAQAFYEATQPLCEVLAEETNRPRRYENQFCSRVEQRLCNHWGTDSGHNDTDIGADLSKPQRRYNFLYFLYSDFYKSFLAPNSRVSANALGTGFAVMLADKLGTATDFNQRYYDGESTVLEDYSRNSVPYLPDEPLPKGFYWPDEPVVAPEAFDALDPITRVHAEFIWRTSAFKEALYGQPLCDEQFEGYDNYRASDCDDGIVRTHHEIPYDKKGWSYRGIEGKSPVVGEECLTRNAAEKYADVDRTLVECRPLRVPLAGLDMDYLEGADWQMGSEEGDAFEGEEQLLYLHDPDAVDHLLFWRPHLFDGNVFQWEGFNRVWSNATGLACQLGYGVDPAGSCKICPSGYSNEDGLGPCERCTRHFVATEAGTQSCSLCPMGQVVNQDHTACIDNPCGTNEYWDITTRRCEKDVRRQHKWVQMQFVVGLDSWLLQAQRDQYKYALLDIRDSVTSQKAIRTDEFVLETAAIAQRAAGDLRKDSEIESFDPEWKTFATKAAYWEACDDSDPETFTDNDFPRSGYDCNISLQMRDCPGNSVRCRGAKTDCSLSYDEPPVARFEHISVKPEDVTTDWGTPEMVRCNTDNDPYEEFRQETLRRLLRDSMHRHEVTQLENLKREKGVFALHFSGHGNGFDSAGIKLKDVRRLIREEFGDDRLGLVSFDMCLMGNYESLLMLEGVTDWVVGHTTPSPLDGWRSEDFLKVPIEAYSGGQIWSKDTKQAELKPSASSSSTKEYIETLITGVRDAQILQGNGGFYETVVSYRMDQFGLFRQAFDAVLNHLAEHIGEHDHLERLERLYYNNNMPLDLSTLNGHIATGRTNEPPYTLKFDTKEFLEAFATSEDGVLRR